MVFGPLVAQLEADTAVKAARFQQDVESLPEDLKDYVTLFRRIEDFQKLDNLTKDIKWEILILTPSLVEISRQVHHDIRRRLPGL